MCQKRDELLLNLWCHFQHQLRFLKKSHLTRQITKQQEWTYAKWMPFPLFYLTLVHKNNRNQDSDNSSYSAVTAKVTLKWNESQSSTRPEPFPLVFQLLHALLPPCTEEAKVWQDNLVKDQHCRLAPSLDTAQLTGFTSYELNLCHHHHTLYKHHNTTKTNFTFNTTLQTASI